MKTEEYIRKIPKEDIDSYRGTERGCVIYLKDKTEIRTQMSFRQVDDIFNF